MRSLIIILAIFGCATHAQAQDSTAQWSLDASTYTGNFLGNWETFANVQVARTLPSGWTYGVQASSLTSPAGWRNNRGEYEEANYLWEAGPFAGYRHRFTSDTGLYLNLSASVGRTDYRRFTQRLGAVDNRGAGPGFASLGQEAGIWFRPSNRMRITAGTGFNQGYAFHAGTWVNRGPMFRAGINLSL